MKQTKYHYLYKTTNLINGKYYIGVHSTYDLDDGYLGSGVLLKKSIQKYGKYNFKLEILEFFDNRKSLIRKERELVTETFIKDELCMNLKPGGSGGFVDEIHRTTFITSSKKTQFSKKYNVGSIRVNELRKTDEMWGIWVCDKVRRGLLKSNFDFGSTFRGKQHTDESKEKIGKANSIHQSGKGNSQYGTLWIHNLTLKENKKIKKTDTIPDGWLLGRKIKF
jgi:hypothetical protein